MSTTPTPIPAAPARPSALRRAASVLVPGGLLLLGGLYVVDGVQQNRRETAAAPAEVLGSHLDRVNSRKGDIRYETEYAYTVAGHRYTAYDANETLMWDEKAPATACYEPGHPERVHLRDGRAACP